MGCSCCKSRSRGECLLGDGPSNQSQVSYGSTTSEVNVTIRVGSVKDICGLNSNKFLILNGTHYIEVKSLKDEISTISDRKPLRDVCQHGDHYLALYTDKAIVGAGSSSRVLTHLSEEEFYVIKEKSCTVAESLSRNTIFKERIFDLHPDCQGGSHYFANRAGFYIIYEDNTCLHVQDMSEHGYQSSTASRFNLHKTFTDGHYYFATDHRFYVVKDHDNFGLVYHRTTDLRSDTDAEMLTVSPSITSSIRRHLNEIDQPPAALAKESPSLRQTCALRIGHQPSPTPPVIDAMSKPSSSNLTVIKWKNKTGEVKTFKLKTLIIHKWRAIGNSVEINWQQLEAWKKRMDDEACCEAVLSHWLDHPTPNYPATWEGLYELLGDNELGQVATDLKQAVENAT